MSGDEPTLEHLRAWAYQPDAADAIDTHGPLDNQDSDLLLHDWRYVPTLIDFAADPGCPNSEYCARILTHYAMHLVCGHRRDEYSRLREAAARARGRHRIDQWAAHVERMLGYAEHRGQVNRATAEQMAIDLLVGPQWYATWDEQTRGRLLTVRIADPATHWMATWHDTHPHHLYINRRTGSYKTAWRNALPPAQVRQVV
ncbi:hypothetical protein WEI85_43120 [Actinomycetes bacterium KLBMP 9797]